MKKILFLISAMIVMGCSSGKESLQGTICRIGNEPFTSLAIQIDSVTVYKLVADDNTIKDLDKNQGRLVKINYCEIDSTELPKKIKVKKHEILNK
jgi:hypothetical protein